MSSDNDEYDRREPRERPARASNRSLWLALGAVGCVTVLGCAGGIGAFAYWGFRAFTADLPPAQATADRFLDLLKDEKIDAAYDLTSPGFRAGQSPAEFAAYVKRFETLTRHTTRTQNGVRLFHDASGKRVFVQTTLSAPNNALTCTLVLVEVDGTWRVDKITVP